MFSKAFIKTDFIMIKETEIGKTTEFLLIIKSEEFLHLDRECDLLH